MREREKLPSLSKVAAGSDAVLSLPIGKTYEQVVFEFSGVTLAQMLYPELILNGKTVQRFDSMQQLQDLNLYYNRNADASGSGVLPWWFIRPELSDPISRRFTALGTADLQTAQIKFTVSGAAAAPAIEAYAYKSRQTPLGMITKIKSFPATFATAGQQDIDNIPRSGARIAAIHLIKSDVSKVYVEVEGRRVLNGLKSSLQVDQEDYGRVPDADFTTIDFLLDGDINHAMATEVEDPPGSGRTRLISDFRIQPTIDTAGSINVLVEYLDGFAGL